MFGIRFSRSVNLDRRLVYGNFSNVVFIFAFVLCFPLFIYLILSFLVLIGFFKTSYLMGSDEVVEPSLFWAVLYNFLDTGNQTSATTDLGRYFALFLALTGSIFMNGLLVSAIIGWYDRFVDKWRCGLARYDEILKTKKCIVIIGANETVPSLIRQLIKKYKNLDYVVVQTMDDVEKIRSRFVSYLKTEEEKK